jgi:hypothetical protein
MTTSSRPPVHAWLLLAVVIGLCAAVVFADVAGTSRLLHVLQKLAHPLIFGVVALLLLALLRRDSRDGPPAQRELALAFGGAVALGALTELLQILVKRDPALIDVGRDAVGALFALSLAAGWRQKQTSGRSTASTAALFSVALVCAVLVFAPLVHWIAAWRHREAAFPVIVDFSSPLDLYFLGTRNGDLRRLSLPMGGGAPSTVWALRVPLDYLPWPGVAVDEPHADWRGYQALMMDLENPTAVNLPLSLRVHDRSHNDEFRDLFNREFTLDARTRQTLRFPLVEIEAAPAGRRLQLQAVAGLMIYRSDRQSGGEFRVYRIWLQ